MGVATTTVVSPKGHPQLFLPPPGRLSPSPNNHFNYRNTRASGGRGASGKSNAKIYGSFQSSDDPGPNSSSVERLQGDDDRLGRLRGQVDEVKEIMKDNVEKVIGRGEKTGELAARTENLAVTSTLFKDNATDLRKQTQRRNWKLMCCIVLVVVIILGIVAVIVLYALKII